MKKIYRYLIIAIGAIASLSSCTKFLDLKPEDKLLEDQVFNSAANTKSYLNGIYVKLGANTLYGENLTLTIPDILAQRYNIGASNTWRRFFDYNYVDGGVAAKMAEIWANGYNAIFNANRLVAGMDKTPGVLDVKTDSLYRGQALAIRAMVHFDMLRLFGPMYNSADSVKMSIPYCTQAEVVVNPFLPANEVMNRIMTDLNKADSLLSNDQSMSFDKKYRFNYYSIKALKARINMYRGNKAEALANAKILIQNAAKFPWVNRTNIMTDKANPDKIFSTEMILGAYNPDLYKESNGQLKLFSFGLTDNNIIAPKDERLTALFASGTADFRYANDQLWAKPATKVYKTFLKYADVEDKTKNFRNTIPMLKLSEMYYIAAECEPNFLTALDYLNTVRYNRNLSILPTTTPPASLQGEILLEYQKEFFGEGQLFYYYKRTNTTSIPNATSASANPPGVVMTAAKYVIPMPNAEITNR